MFKSLTGMVLILIAVVSVCYAAQVRYESSKRVTKSMMGYGKNAGVITGFAVDVNGVIQTQ